MIVYVPRLIESAAQAEALPEGAIVTQEDRDGPWEKWPDGYFRGASKTVVGPERVVDRFALVPIEAEEETSGYIKYGRFGDEAYTGTLTRYTTPWKES